MKTPRKLASDVQKIVGVYLRKDSLDVIGVILTSINKLRDLVLSIKILHGCKAVCVYIIILSSYAGCFG